MSGRYLFNGRNYSTVNGLSRAIFKDSGCDEHTAVKVNTLGQRYIAATVGRGINSRLVAEYHLDAPELGKDMRVTRVQS